MLSVREWLANELRSTGRTAFDFFTECYNKTYSKPCRSNQVVLDATHYRSIGLIPIYVHSVYERMVASLRRIPPNAVPGNEAYHKFQVVDHFVLVDPEPGWTIMPRKGRDGVWR